MKEKLKSKKARLIIMHIGIFAVLALYVIAVNKTDLDCPSKMLFDLPCPFCGMTRAHLSALRLDFSSAFSYHPLFPLALPMLFFAFHRKLFPCISKKAYDIILISCGLLFFAVYLLRLFL